jgi:hypothetical protein
VHGRPFLRCDLLSLARGGGKIGRTVQFYLWILYLASIKNQEEEPPRPKTQDTYITVHTVHIQYPRFFSKKTHTVQWIYLCTYDMYEYTVANSLRVIESWICIREPLLHILANLQREVSSLPTYR